MPKVEVEKGNLPLMLSVYVIGDLRNISPQKTSELVKPIIKKWMTDHKDTPMDLLVHPGDYNSLRLVIDALDIDADVVPHLKVEKYKMLIAPRRKPAPPTMYYPPS
jgi:hypothetical protein